METSNNSILDSTSTSKASTDSSSVSTLNASTDSISASDLNVSTETYEEKSSNSDVMKSANIEVILEAIIFSSPVPIRKEQLYKILEEYSKEDISLAVYTLLNKYNAKNSLYGFCLVVIDGGYQFRTKVEYRDYVLRMFKRKPRVLSPTTLEVLAIIAYKQPITRAEIEQLRGVDCASQIKTLFTKNLIRIDGKKDEAGKPNLYGTTKEFLEVFGLPNLKNLPSLDEIISENP